MLLCVELPRGIGNKTNLVAEALGRDDRDLIANPLVRLEIESKLWIVPLDNYLSGLLNGLRSNTAHCKCDGFILLDFGKGNFT